MGFGLTAELVAEFAAKSFIQRAIANPRIPQSILSFWFGIDVNEEDSKRQLKDSSILSKVRFCMKWLVIHSAIPESSTNMPSSYPQR